MSRTAQKQPNVKSFNYQEGRFDENNEYKGPKLLREGEPVKIIEKRMVYLQ